MSEVRFTSSNITSIQPTLVNYAKPNTTYTFTLDGIVHLKGNGNPSGLSYSNVINYNGSLYTPGTNIELITPSDNVTVDLELVRNGDNISIKLLNFAYENYDAYNYDFKIKAYNETGLTSTVSSVDMNNNNNIYSMILPTNFETTGYYFQLEDFYNTTANTNVYANTSPKSVLKQRVYDVRGLAYFRNTSVFTTSNDNLTVDAGIPNNKLLKNRLSSDGTVLFQVVPGSSLLVLYKYVAENWMKKHKIDNTQINKYTSSSRYGTNDHFVSAALSGDAKRCVVASSGGLIGYVINDDITFDTNNNFVYTVPDVYTNNGIHEVSMSMDGETILISGCDNNFNSGYTHVTGSGGTNFIDLSSSNITDRTTQDSYGTDSTLSGDGKTVAVVGVTSSGTGSIYIWKFNHFTNIWEFVTTKTFSASNRKAPCKLSHYGNILFVCVSDKTIIFETTDGREWTETNTASNSISGSMSGDGKTYIVVQNNNAIIGRNNGSSWTTQTISITEPNTGIEFMDMSFDGSVSVISNESTADTDEMVFVYGDKTSTISSVLDYMNVKSEYFFYNYEFDYTTGISSWNTADTSEHTIHTRDDLAHSDSYGYGHWDATSISADGRFVLVGASANEKVYLYDTSTNNKHTFEEPSANQFGLRCAMDDLAKHVAIVDASTIHVYTRSFNGFSKITITHEFNSVFQFKMSKDGSTIVLSESINSTSLKKWVTNNSWSTSVSPETLNHNSNKVSAFDMSFDGTSIVAGQWTTAGGGPLTMFTSDNIKVSININTEDTRYFHSVAMSAITNTENKYTIITGEARSYGSDMDTTSFHVLTFDTSSNTFSTPVERTITGLSPARYGRTAEMSYDGSFALLSGTKEDNEPARNTTGGAVLINVTNALVSSSSFFIQSFSKTDGIEIAEATTSSIEDRFNGYGSGCVISSDNQHILVSGGGYAYKYSSTGGGGGQPQLSTAVFPLASHSNSNDDELSFTGISSFDGSSARLNNTTMSVSLPETGPFVFDPIRSFLIEFDFKMNTNVDSLHLGQSIILVREPSGAFDFKIVYRENHYNAFSTLKQNGSTIYYRIGTGTLDFSQFKKLVISYISGAGVRMTLNGTHVLNGFGYWYNVLTGLDFGNPNQTIEVSTAANVSIKNFKIQNYL